MDSIVTQNRRLIHQKLEQAVELLQAGGVDCWLTFVRETAVLRDPVLPFLCGGDLTWHSALIVTRGGGKHAIVGSLERQGVAELEAYDSVTGYVEGIREPLVKLLDELSPRTLAVNYSPDSEIADGLTHGMFLVLQKILSQAGFRGELVSAEPVISSLRARKSPAELDRIKRAIAETLSIFANVREFVRPGRSEAEIAQFMLGQVDQRGLTTAWERSHCPAVFTGPDTAEAHYRPTDRRVAPGHILNMDFGVRFEDYCSDLQRTWYIPEPGTANVPEEVQHGFATIVEAIDRARREMRPGRTGVEIDAVARNHIIDGGYDSFPHALGHQVGRFAHDGTALLGPLWEKYGMKPRLPLEEGMVFTLEPRLTIPGRGVVTIEEMVVVKEKGAVFLSEPQRDLWLSLG
ncbi:MAG: Xaa-Pro peptidase family protein [Acidobacteriota bacterium]